jgi:hypothetical protein
MGKTMIQPLDLWRFFACPPRVGYDLDMLTPNQEKYLQKIPENQKVSIKLFDQKAWPQPYWLRLEIVSSGVG